MTVQRRSACFFFIWGCKHKMRCRPASNLENVRSVTSFRGSEEALARGVLGEQGGQLGHPPSSNREVGGVREPKVADIPRGAERGPNRGGLFRNERNGQQRQSRDGEIGRASGREREWGGGEGRAVERERDR